MLRDFAELWPERFHNVTNGVTPRRFVVLSNPALAQLLDETVGDGWITDLARLAGLEAHADDAAFQERWRRIKRANKEALARRIRSAHRRAWSIRTRCSTSRSSASTSTSAST